MTLLLGSIAVEGVGSRRHHGPLRRKTRQPMISVAPRPPGMPAKMKVMIRGHRAAERAKLVVAEARRQSDTDQERDGIATTIMSYMYRESMPVRNSRR